MQGGWEYFLIFYVIIEKANIMSPKMFWDGVGKAAWRFLYYFRQGVASFESQFFHILNQKIGL